MKKVFLFMLFFSIEIFSYAQLPYMVKDINVGSNASGSPSLGSNIGNIYFFSANNDPVNQNYELWRTDGTDAGTYILKDIVSGSVGSYPKNFFNFNNILYFCANSDELWRSDGTDAGTYLVKSINNGTSSANLKDFVVVGSQFFFTAYTPTTGNELWVSNGTTGGTHLVKDIEVGSNNGLSASSNSLINYNGAIFFSGGLGTNKGLWRSDGTDAGTYQIKSFTTPANITTDKWRVANNLLFFTASDGTAGIELWKTDGTNAGTIMVKDIYVGSTSSDPANLIENNGILYFSAKGSSPLAIAIYKSDGTTSGTLLAANIFGASTTNASMLSFINNSLFFRASNSSYSNVLMKADLNAATSSQFTGGQGFYFYPNQIVKVNADYYFDSYFNINGNGYLGLWKTDDNSSILLKSFPNMYLRNIYNANNKLYFTAYYIDSGNSNYNYGEELFSLGNCSVNNVINSSANKIYSYNAQQQTNPSIMCYGDVFNNLLVTVNSNGSNPVSGNVQVTQWIDNTQPNQYLKRHYEITPANNPSSSTGKITMYFTQAEFDAFNAVNTLKLPTSPTDVTGIANLMVEKRSGVSTDGSGNPFTYTSSIETINPADADIVWNATQSRWEVSVNVSGFSGFFIKTLSTSLPLNLLQFAAQKQQENILVSWSTINEFNVNSYNIERSYDLQNFEKIGEQTATVLANNGINHYSYIDKNFKKNNVVYYRLKIVDKDNRVSYSPTIAIKFSYSSDVSIYPNPTKDNVSISSYEKISKVQIINTLGIVVKTINSLNCNSTTLSLSDLPKGIYQLKIFTESESSIVKKIVKE